MKKEAMILGIVSGILGLAGPAPAQMQKAPPATAAQMPADSRPAPDGLVKLLESKGILSSAEAAIASEAALQPQTKQVLAEMLLSKHLITNQEYDRTIEACSSAAARTAPTAVAGSGEAAGREAAGSEFNWSGEGKFSKFKSFSDWISSILPGGAGNNYLDFGTLQAEPPGAENAQGESRQAGAKAKHKPPTYHR